MNGWICNLNYHPLVFKTEARTSRGGLLERRTWFLTLKHAALRNKGVGEVGIIPGLSPEDVPDFETQMAEVVKAWVAKLPPPSFTTTEGERAYHIAQNIPDSMPALRFAAECAWNDLMNGGEQLWYDSPFAQGQQEITINGLVWMDSIENMEQQVAEKIVRGFRTIKIKISSEGWNQELELLQKIRRNHGTVTIRVDANGAFQLRQARQVLDALQALEVVHSIEQPIKAGQWDKMTSLCKQYPGLVALDEELIGVSQPADQRLLLETIQPAYIVLKPSLLGGLNACHGWIRLAESMGIGWWLTSALESNVGLGAIAQFAATKNCQMAQGLGTGGLYTNNIASPLELRGEKLAYKPTERFVFPPLW